MQLLIKSFLIRLKQIWAIYVFLSAIPTLLMKICFPVALKISGNILVYRFIERQADLKKF